MSLGEGFRGGTVIDWAEDFFIMAQGVSDLSITGERLKIYEQPGDFI